MWFDPGKMVIRAALYTSQYSPAAYIAQAPTKVK